MSYQHQKIIFFKDDINNKNILFQNPIKEIICYEAKDIAHCFQQLEKYHQDGYWLAGYFSYELGYCLDDNLIDYLPQNRKIPLIYFAIFNAPTTELPNFNIDKKFNLDNLTPTLSFDDYKIKFDKLVTHLKNGDLFQGNLTFPFTADWNGNAWNAFLKLAKNQPVSYSVFCNLGDEIILSRSPELFFNIDEYGWIETRPMKGTSPRGKTQAEDQKLKNQLKNDPKNLCENVMIVDLLRNDIARICEPKSLTVTKLFDIETYKTLHQMVSSIKAKLLPNLTLYQIFSALFPCGSITGVPKIRTMQILKELEVTSRDIYCGTLGYISPKKELNFNVAIRTLTLYKNNKAILNAGGGVIYDSTALEEYQEALLKTTYINILK
ncbi:aminodeoxychorismate synthase component I [Bartonella sp. DGB1]|uniref:aminodeoxychorismate synthase component I n=1 Tax=Bartonella sp. DGB1 TaxID=3239807 RepID=UPI00352662BE